MKVDRILRLWRLGVRARALIQQRRLSQTLAHVEVVFFQRRHQRRRFLHARNHFPSSGFLRVDPQARLYVFTHFYAPVLLCYLRTSFSLFSKSKPPRDSLKKGLSLSLSVFLLKRLSRDDGTPRPRVLSARERKEEPCESVCSCEIFSNVFPPPDGVRT